MEILPLKSLNKNGFEELSSLDKYFYQKYGESFSNEFWTKENFEYPLPSKFELSFVVLINDTIIGYCIASIKNKSVYIHRFAIKSEMKKSDGFFKEILKHYNQKKIYLMVNCENKPASLFYEKYGFNIVENIKEIRSFVAEDLNIKKNKIVISEGYECFLMRKV
jgi:ribosomal protein S18 acetylase RimI-like enzyme